MKLDYFKHSLFLLLAGFILCNCSNDDEFAPTTDGTVLNIQATAQGFLSIDGINTRAKEEGNTTYFTDDDEIGVFAQKADGSIIEGCKNLKLTYSTKDGWTGNTVFYYKDAKYFAYYPYSANNDNKKSVDEIVKEFIPKSNQSTYAQYTENDLMATEAVLPDATTKRLSFNFKHKMSMVEISLPMQEYQTLDASYKYSIPILDATFRIEDETVSPYYMGSGVFRYIITPDKSITVSGEFTELNGKTTEYSRMGLSLKSNSYKRLNVVRNSDGVASRNLKVGDFYYSDGSIVPEDTNEPPKEGCIGVIFNVNKDSFIEKESTYKANGGFIHALVIALNDASQDTTWGEAVTAVSKYAAANATPEKSTGWYFPNKSEFQKITGYTLHDLLNRQLNKVDDATQISTAHYWVQMYLGVYPYVQGGAVGNTNSETYKGPYARAVLAF